MWFDLCVVLVTAWIYSDMLGRNETRACLVEIHDPLFEVLPIWDTSVPCAGILYACFALFALHWGEWSVPHFAWTFTYLMLSRLLVLWMLPLKGHHTQRPLRDPLIEWVRGEQPVLRSDTSFSGHVSTVVALGLLCETHREFFWVSAAITAALLVLSRVHYTADCVIAPAFAYACYMLAR